LQTGISYFTGDPLPGHYHEVVPIETYKHIIQLRRQSPSVTFEGQSQPQSPTTAQEAYPNLRVLLKFDTAQFLNVVRTAVDAPIFSVDGRLKRLVDVLIGVVEAIAEKEMENGREGEEERCRLASELVPFVCSLLEREVISKDPHLFTQLVERALESGGGMIEKDVLELMRLVPEIDEQRVLDAAMRSER